MKNIIKYSFSVMIMISSVIVLTLFAYKTLIIDSAQDDISSEETLDWELTPLRMIKDSYPKIVIANTKHDTYDLEGIKVYDLARWLLFF